jgi:hypothetical protein
VLERIHFEKVWFMRVEDEYFDVLQNLEWAIVNEFRQDRSILDVDAREAAHALVRHYEAESESRGAPHARLSERATRIFEATRLICEWRLGRAPLAAEEPAEINAPLSVAELVLCLKRIRKSIDFWTKEGGRQGYLNYVSEYVR